MDDPKLITFEIIQRIQDEIAIWHTGIGNDADAQWRSLGIEPDTAYSVCQGILEIAITYEDMETGLAKALAYTLMLGIRIGREQ